MVPVFSSPSQLVLAACCNLLHGRSCGFTFFFLNFFFFLSNVIENNVNPAKEHEEKTPVPTVALDRVCACLCDRCTCKGVCVRAYA